MRIILINHPEELLRELQIPGNPILRYDRLRTTTGEAILHYNKNRWHLIKDGSLWTDIEIREV